MNFLYFLLIISAGFAIMIYNRWLVDNTTRIELIEERFGGGSTYIFVKLVGLVFIMFSFYVLVNGMPF